MDVLTVGRPLGDHDRLDMSEKPLAELMGGSMVSRTGIQAYGRGRAEVEAGLGDVQHGGAYASSNFGQGSAGSGWELLSARRGRACRARVEMSRWTGRRGARRRRRRRGGRGGEAGGDDGEEEGERSREACLLLRQ